MPAEDIKITTVQAKIAINVFTVSATDESSKLDFFSSKVLLKNLHKFKKTIHAMHSAKIGKNIAKPASIPKAPTLDLSKLKQPFMVPKASLIAPPTIGIQLSSINLTLEAPKLSAESVMIFCKVSMPTKNPAKNFKKI